MSPSLLWRAWRLGLGVASTGDGHGPGPAKPEWSQQRLRALLFGEPLPPLQGENPGRAAWRRAPCWWPTSPVATHLLGTPVLPLCGGCADPGRRGRGALPDRAPAHPLAPLRRLATAGWSWLRRFALTADDPVESKRPPQHSLSASKQVLARTHRRPCIPVDGQVCRVGHAQATGRCAAGWPALIRRQRPPQPDSLTLPLGQDSGSATSRVDGVVSGEVGKPERRSPEPASPAARTGRLIGDAPALSSPLACGQTATPPPESPGVWWRPRARRDPGFPPLAAPPFSRLIRCRSPAWRRSRPPRRGRFRSAAESVPLPPDAGGHRGSSTRSLSRARPRSPSRQPTPGGWPPANESSAPAASAAAVWIRPPRPSDSTGCPQSDPADGNGRPRGRLQAPGQHGRPRAAAATCCSRPHATSTAGAAISKCTKRPLGAGKSPVPIHTNSARATPALAAAQMRVLFFDSRRQRDPLQAIASGAPTPSTSLPRCRCPVRLAAAAGLEAAAGL